MLVYFHRNIHHQSDVREPQLLMGYAYGWIKPEAAVRDIICASKLLVSKRLARTGL